MTKRDLKEIAKEVIIGSRINVVSRAYAKAIECDLSSDEKEYVLRMIDVYLNHLQQYLRK